MNPRSAYGYNRFRFVEFLDLLGAVAEFNFRGSELAGLSMAEKLWFTIQEVLKVSGTTDEAHEDEDGGSVASSATLNTDDMEKIMEAAE